MEPITLDRAVEVVRALNPSEQQQLRRLMDSWQIPQTSLAKEREFAEHLLAKGLITHIPEGYPASYSAEDEDARHPPIVLDGEPLSETIIRERR